MKSLINLLTICIALLFTNCNKGGIFGSKKYTGTIVAVGCATVAIDIDGDTGTGKGVAWTDRDGKNHTNAVTVKNFCYIASLNLQSGDKISFTETTSDKTNPPPCMTPYCLMSGPSSEVFVNNVEKE